MRRIRCALDMPSTPCYTALDHKSDLVSI
jgi:hypothetical protein